MIVCTFMFILFVPSEVTVPPPRMFCHRLKKEKWWRMEQLLAGDNVRAVNTEEMTVPGASTTVLIL